MTGASKTLAAMVAACAVVAACSAVTPPSVPAPAASPVDGEASPSAPRASQAQSTPVPSSFSMADAKTCAVTLPRPVPSAIGDSLFGGGSAFGNRDLWVGGLGDQGVIVADNRMIESDGAIGWKLGWYRIVSGSLTITGHRLDASAPPVRPSVPDGYGPRGFQATGVDFPTEGCWQVTGTVGDASLTFVTFVIVQ